MDFRIRAATPEDCKDISRMIMELAVYENMPDQVKISHEVLEQDGFCKNPFFHCLVAEVAEQYRTTEGYTVIGYALFFYTYSTWKGRSVYMEDLYVMPEFRGHFLYNVDDAEHVGKATVCRAVRTVCLVLKRFLHTFVQIPGHKALRVIKEEFHRVAGFPNVIGCIDGTHIPIKAPSINEGDCVNRKSIHSINVQVICEATHIITNVEAKWPGSVHDARTFRESSLWQTFQQGKGVGTALMSKVAQVGKEQQCVRLQFSVLNWNTPSLDFYKAKGAQDLTDSEGWHVLRFDGEALDKLAQEAPKN